MFKLSTLFKREPVTREQVQEKLNEARELEDAKDPIVEGRLNEFQSVLDTLPAEPTKRDLSHLENIRLLIDILLKIAKK
jgi:hypothetical protein